MIHTRSKDQNSTTRIRVMSRPTDQRRTTTQLVVEEQYHHQSTIKIYNV
jgi:hypothetical protein